jgi:3-hydroxyacyl-[acyl-carrier-protein] dehydratase
MLLGSLYWVTGHRLGEGFLEATLALEPGHPIFQGHFPGQPVVPGVCMMQVVKELLEAYALAETPTRLVHADSAKFLSLIDPRDTRSVEAELRYVRDGDIKGDIKVVARLYNETTTFFKYSAVFRIS